MSIKGQGLSLTLAKSHSVFQLFSETVGLFDTKYYVKDLESTGMKIYTNELDHMTKLAIPIYSKNPSSPEPVGQLQ